MESSPSNSIEKQIDNFLEQFKRSASKAMDADWCVTISANTTANSANIPIPTSSPVCNAIPANGGNTSSPTTRFLQRTRSRSSCLDSSDLSDNDVENGISESKATVMSAAQHRQQQQLINNHMLESQTSVCSATSVQTVFFQSAIDTIYHSYTNDNDITQSDSTCDNSNIKTVENGIVNAVDTTNSSIRNSSGETNPSEHINSLMDHINPAAAAAAMSGDGVLNIGDVADLLHPQHAIITGGRSQEGCPLIIFPDNNNFQSLEEADYQKLILYLSSVPSLQDADLGFHLIVDRRKDKWASVKTVLQRISIYFPGIIHVVYVLRPMGLFQKAISEVSSKFSKDEYRFRLVICSVLSDLHEFISPSQLTADMGGKLVYSHHEWIQQRISLEKFSSLTHQVSSELDIFIQAIHDTEFPNSVEATQQLLDDQGADYERLKEEILAAAKHGETLLNNIKLNDEIKEFSERTGNVSAIERLLVQLEETERRFDEFWRTHRNRLQQCLELRRFEHDFRELQITFDEHLKCVADMTEIGESVERVDALIEDTEKYQNNSLMDFERAYEVISAGQQLIGMRGVYPWEIVQPKCDELQRVCDIIGERLKKRLEILRKNRELMERVEKANQWCANGIELLGSQHIEKCSVSVELADQSLQEMQAFIASAAEFKLSSPSEFKKIFLESTTPETKALVSQVLQRIDDVSLMCDKRIASLKKMALKPPRPIQTVTPEPAVPLQPPGGAPAFQRQMHKTDVILKQRPRSMNGAIDSGISLNGDASSSPDSAADHIQNQQDSEARRLNCGHALNELLETERMYVHEMSSILKGYYDQIKNDDLKHLIPPTLLGKEDVLFGNLHQIFTFHNDVFLKDLENSISRTEWVALCFVERRKTFYQLYSFYCQNLIHSERLRETLVDTHLFLQECQKRLGHKLPLAAYLLKPVQRITKYQLILERLLRSTDNGVCTKELKNALDCMLVVLNCVNDSMHQNAIQGYQIDWAEHGELLMQDSFQVRSKKDIRLRRKPQQRHIFLYQKCMLFCKETSKPGLNKSSYQFKHHIKMSLIGLTESVSNDAKSFEVWLQGRQEVHTIQAQTVEIKNKWVAEIKRVLFNQLEELKGENIKQYGLQTRILGQISSGNTPNTVINATSRTQSCDASIDSSSHHSNYSSDDNCPITRGSINSNISNATTSNTNDKEPSEIGGWNSDNTNSEDELSNIEDNSTPGSKFVALADFVGIGHSEVSLREGETLELLKVGCAGWWFVRKLETNAEGWTPAAYLESINRKSSRSSSRNQERIIIYH